MHPHAIDRAERRRIERVPIIEDALILRIALDERVPRQPLVGHEAPKQEQRVRPGPGARRGLTEAKNGAVVESHRSDGRVGAQRLLRHDVRVSHTQYVVDAALRRQGEGEPHGPQALGEPQVPHPGGESHENGVRSHGSPPQNPTFSRKVQ